MSARSQLTGRRFGRLFVLLDVGSYKGNSRWLTRCDCGNFVVHSAGNLLTNNVQSCGCFLADWIRSTKRLRPFESLYNTLKSRCRANKNLSCELSYEDFLKFTKQENCHYCNDYIQWTKFNININGGGCNLDRKDNNLPYSVDNCAVCCATCNRMKSDIAYAVFIQQVRKIAANL